MKIIKRYIITYISFYYIFFIALLFSFLDDCIQISQILNCRQKPSNGEYLMDMFLYSFVILVVMISII